MLMPWYDDGWRDSYDAWKTRRSPDDEGECPHEDYEIGLDGRARCNNCQANWWPAVEEEQHFRYLNQSNTTNTGAAKSGGTAGARGGVRCWILHFRSAGASMAGCSSAGRGRVFRSLIAARYDSKEARHADDADQIEQPSGSWPRSDF